MYSLVVTGGRHWTNSDAIREALTELLKVHADLVVHVGDATGADAITRAACGHLGIPFTVHRAEWQRYGRAAGPMRNLAMLDAANADLVLAFPGAGESRGTRGCMAAAEARGIQVVVHGGEVVLDAPQPHLW